MDVGHPNWEEALAVGVEAPGFVLPDEAGQPIALTDGLSRGGLLLIFYRGDW